MVKRTELEHVYDIIMERFGESFSEWVSDEATRRLEYEKRDVRK